MLEITWLDRTQPNQAFPALHNALEEPNGLLAAGGCLSTQRLYNAYQHGCFPWFNEGEPLLWWSPNPRAVLPLTALHIPRSLRKSLRKHPYHLTLDQAFPQVIQQCATIRRTGNPGTWITNQMQQAYCQLHQAGFAHSIELWDQQTLVGGVYGVSLGKAFFGESMFSYVPNASKIALVTLAKQLQRWQFDFIDCQLSSPHLTHLGAQTMSRVTFKQRLDHATQHPDHTGQWQLDQDLSCSSEQY